MILYAESSAVLRWLFNDSLADQVFDELIGARKVVCSRLTLIECRRAAGGRFRSLESPKPSSARC